MSFSVSFAPSLLLFLLNALGVPSAKIPISGATFISYILPPLVCYFVVAVLAVSAQTHTVRLALWPLVVLLTLRAALSVDIPLSQTDQTSFNIDFTLCLYFVVGRTLDWAVAKGPLVRHLRPANSSPSTIMDALDLSVNTRGLGWQWSRGLYVPREKRPANRLMFALRALLSVIVHTIIRGSFHRAILTLTPVGVGPVQEGSTIFDDTLPFLVRYFRASVISTFAIITIYALVQMSYDAYAIPSILILGQDPSQWPPVFDAPWRSTSLADFWGRRWHQFLRRTFLVFGGYPLSYFLGPSGIVIGAFLVSAIMHHVGLIAKNSQLEIWWMLVGFGMMAPGILAERAFYRLTGRRVGGVVGWFWTMTWLVLWGNVIVEGFVRGGMFHSASFVESPLKMSVEHLMVEFDAWLHTF